MTHRSRSATRLLHGECDSCRDGRLPLCVKIAHINLADYPFVGRCNDYQRNAAVIRLDWRSICLSSGVASYSGHVGTCPLAFERIFSLGSMLKQVVWFGLVCMPNCNSALFVQPYSLWNDAITGYNGACAKLFYRATPCVSAVFVVG